MSKGPSFGAMASKGPKGPPGYGPKGPGYGGFSDTYARPKGVSSSKGSDKRKPPDTGADAKMMNASK